MPVFIARHRHPLHSAPRPSFWSVSRKSIFLVVALLVLAAEFAQSTLSGHRFTSVRRRRADYSPSETNDKPRVLLLTTWTVPIGTLPAVPSRAQCASAFAGARVLLNTVAARGLPARGTDTVVVHNTPCTSFFNADDDGSSAASDDGVASVSGVSVPMREHGRFHVFDERWLWYAAVLDAARLAGADAVVAADTSASRVARSSTPRDAWNATTATTLSGTFWTDGVSTPFTHALVMDARDAELLAPPAAFFSSFPDGDLFAGEECTPVGGNPWMLERYEPCVLDYGPYAEQQIINAGVVGGRIRALRWLAGEIVQALFSAEERAGRTCTGPDSPVAGIDMILLNHVLRTRAAAAGVHVVVGDPFVATYKRAPYNIIALRRSAATGATGVPEPDENGTPSGSSARVSSAATAHAWPSASDCGCEYGSGGKYAESKSAFDPRAEVVCRRCLPFLAAHKVSVVWRDAL